ncbi:uncharacterized protein DNG_08545 [Cephalotrichum gorgonifer]|uniref:Diaminohydroxyphosphoribosylamino-pyrimidine deaminase n=1 Tax=Cephalotrichum gorgonifer TaxID=2041049 RepID=A0AAE8N665_9PEZI|nr:uncharacterized protein DNG_08545 [Cephalotrichum gorgonifer]
MAVSEFLGLLGSEIEDPDEETFLLFAQPIPSSDLGFVDRQALSVPVSVGGREYVVEQAPGVLGSARAGGTTGAVLWNVTPRLAEWLSSPTNPLFTSILGPSSCVLELGCGTSGLLALTTAGRVGRYTLTDQAYVLKTLSANLIANEDVPVPAGGRPPPRRKPGKREQKKEWGKRTAGQAQAGPSLPAGDALARDYGAAGNIAFAPLDWELDVPDPSLTRGAARSFDVVLACDCIYNDALVLPFVRTCAEACALRPSSGLRPDSHSESGSASASGGGGGLEEGGEGGGPTVCIVAQQLRDPEVFAAWMEAFHERFRTWRVPDEIIGNGLGSGSGFVVHAGVLR